MQTLLLLILPALVSCKITVTIETATSIEDSTVTTRGVDSNIITDAERFTFGISDDVLKNAAEKYSGGRPQDVFLHSPTPWNDLYQTYGWREVRRNLKAVKTTILDVQSENTVIALKEFDNNSSVSIKFDASVLANVDHIVQNKWHKAGILDIKEPIDYFVTGPSIFSYSSPWGRDAEQIKKVEIGSSTDVEVSLEPGQAVSTALKATKVSMIIQIDYAASLSGHVACNYPKKYNGHHFWRYEINGLMGAAGLIRTVNSAEVITVKFYTNASIIVTNKETKAKVTQIPAVFSAQ